MELDIPEYLHSFNIFAGAAALLATLWLIWSGTARRPITENGRYPIAVLLSLGLLAWFAVAHVIGQANVYWAPHNLRLPTIPLGIILPIIVAVPLLLRSRRIAALVDAIPLSWLVGVQVYRVIGGVFLVLWWDERLPEEFALPAGIGDVAVGILAVVVAGMLVSGTANARSSAYAWCLFGIADLVVAVTLGTLTSPGTLHLLAPDQPNLLITAYPLVMVPTFAVPLSIILHALCLWKVHRDRPTQDVSRPGASTLATG